MLTSVWSFCLPKHTFLRTNWLGGGRFGWLFLSVYVFYDDYIYSFSLIGVRCSYVSETLII